MQRRSEARRPTQIESDPRSRTRFSRRAIEERPSRGRGYFEEYKELEDDNAKAEFGGQHLLDEALVEHAGAKHLIEEIEAMDVGDDLYDAKISVLGEQIKHHVKEEEEELFPEIEDSKMDVVAVGRQLATRKAELMARSGMMAEAK